MASNTELERHQTELSFEIFGEVARLAVLQELKIRLLADKTESIKDAAFEFHAFETEKKVIGLFSQLGHLEPEEAPLLSKTRAIRNKILQCEFSVAVKKIEDFIGSALPGPNVQSL